MDATSDSTELDVGKEYATRHLFCTPTFLDEQVGAVILGETPASRLAAQRARRRAEAAAYPDRRAQAKVHRGTAGMTRHDWAALDEWHQRGVNPDIWRLAGLGRFDAHIAQQCDLYGLTPEMVRDGRLDGRRINELLGSGESGASVYARLHKAS